MSVFPLAYWPNWNKKKNCKQENKLYSLNFKKQTHKQTKTVIFGPVQSETRPLSQHSWDRKSALRYFLPAVYHFFLYYLFI